MRVSYLICGGPGTGKTTLARELAAREGHRVIHLDDYLFEHGRTDMIARAVDDVTAGCIVEGCEATRLLSYGVEPARVLWLGPTNPVKYAPRYRRLVGEWIDALDASDYPVIYLPRKSSFEDVTTIA